MEEPEIVIVIEKGVVCAVATSKAELTYRVIDLDVREEGRRASVEDMEADATGINVEEYTQEMTEETGES